MVRYKLNVAERLNLMTVLPAEGNFVTLKVIRDLLEVLGIKSEEHKKYDLREEPTGSGKWVWNNAGIEEKDFDVSETAAGIIATELKKLDADGKLKQNHFSLYEKFVQDKGGN